MIANNDFHLYPCLKNSFAFFSWRLVAWSVILCCVLTSCGKEERGQDETEELLARVDDAIAGYEMVRKGDLRSIDTLRLSLTESLKEDDADNKRVCALSDTLFSKYLYVDADSAIKYARVKILWAYDTVSRASAYYNLAKALITKGHETDAYDCLVETFPDTANPAVKPYYYDLMIFRKRMLNEDPIRWFRRLDKIVPSGSASAIISEAYIKGSEGHPAEGVKMIQSNMDKLAEEPLMAETANLQKGELQLQSGDTAGAIRSFARAAEIDLTLPTYRYRALSELANLLSRKEDFSRAYRYVDFSNDRINETGIIGDVKNSNAIMSEVVKTYEDYQQKQQHRRLLLIYVLVGVSLLLVLSLFAMLYAHKKSVKARRELLSVHKELTAAHSELAENSARIKEIDTIKSAYLLEYMRQCSIHIDSIDRFKGVIEVAVRTKGLKGVEAALKRKEGSADLKEFYANFDRTFLHLFPGFIEELNKLLKPEGRVELTKDGTLSNEIRVLALIRLGITDSATIAEFLRRSVTTVYNYRVKMRNNALGNRDDFEERVKKIMLIQ